MFLTYHRYPRCCLFKGYNRCDVSIGRLDGKLSPTLSLDWTIIHIYRQGELSMAQIIDALYAKKLQWEPQGAPVGSNSYSFRYIMFLLVLWSLNFDVGIFHDFSLIEREIERENERERDIYFTPVPPRYRDVAAISNEGGMSLRLLGVYLAA